MRPYYQAGNISIYHGDAREVVPALPAGLTATDPPYNVGYAYEGYSDRLPAGEYRALLATVIRTPAIVIHYPEGMFEVAAALGKAPERVVAWVYHANTPRQWRSLAWFGAAPDMRAEGQEYRNPTDRRVAQLIAEGRQARLYDWWLVEQVKNVSDAKTDHPCQIPLPVMRRALKITPSDLPVIDPFCGSGTTLVAAKELGRAAVGVEQNERYCEIAALRLSQEVLAFEDAA